MSEAAAVPVTRLQPLPFEQWSDDARAQLPSYLRRPELFTGPDALPMPTVLGLLAHHLPIGDSWLEFNRVLADETALDERLRELLVLRVAWRARATYEWYQHVRIAHHAGITTEQLHAIPDGADADVWTPLERALLRAVDQMVDAQGIDAETWAELGRHLDDAALLEVLFVTGAYLCFAIVLNSIDLPADPPTEPIDAPDLPERGA
jgi:alkylhydroperoxidase family enzyme